MCKWLLLLSLSQWFICKLLTEFLNLKLTNAKPKINTTSLLLNWEIARNLTAFLMISCLETHNCSPSCFATLYRVHVDFLKSPTGFVFSLSCKCTNKQELYLIGPLRVDISIQVFRTWGVKIALPLFCLYYESIFIRVMYMYAIDYCRYHYYYHYWFYYWQMICI